MGTKTRIAFRLGLIAAGVGLVLSLACSDDDSEDNDANAPEPVATSTTGSNAPQTVQVIAADYNFKDLPQTLAVGLTIEMRNESSKEVHELVAIRLPDTEKRPVSQLIQLPDEELGEIASTEPSMVLVAMPNEKGMAVLGDGKLTQAGRYAVLCFIPTGADPAAVAAAMSEGGNEPPELEGGPPHAFNGMFAEVTVR
jgi:hypothetical protein